MKDLALTIVHYFNETVSRAFEGRIIILEFAGLAQKSVQLIEHDRCKLWNSVIVRRKSSTKTRVLYFGDAGAL